MKGRKMKKVAITILVLMCNQAFGLTLMGPPMAELEQGQHSAGIDFSYGDMDIEESALGGSSTVGVESFAYLINLGYGISDNWEAFALLGLTDAEHEDLDTSSEFAYGFGTKFTISQLDYHFLGGLFQITWSEAEDTAAGIIGEVEIDYYEIQMAVGLTYTDDTVSIYGGPFLHFIDGEVDYKTLGVTSDIEQESEFGGYIGLNKALAENINWQIELQFTGDAHAICTGIGWKF
jgi:hypothetical protein